MSNIHLFVYSCKTILVISSVRVEVLCSFAEGNDAAVGYRKTFSNKLRLFCGLQMQERTSNCIENSGTACDDYENMFKIAFTKLHV